MNRGLLLGAIQVALVLAVTGQFLYDRASLPRAWARSLPYDPSMPIRGRYVSLTLQVDADCKNDYGQRWELFAQDGRLRARRSASGKHTLWEQNSLCRLSSPVPFFIPPQIPDPSQRPPGEELWVEVSVPKSGPPRPIRLAVKKDGRLEPLEIR
jgi:hypothetical protein